MYDYARQISRNITPFQSLPFLQVLFFYRIILQVFLQDLPFLQVLVQQLKH